MILKLKDIKQALFRICLFSFVLYGIFDQQIFCTDDSAYQDHGWAMLDSVRSFMPYPIDFYAMSRGLQSRLHDGMSIRIRALKTGFGNYYKVEKNKNGGWILKASTKDAKDSAAQFLVSKKDKHITLESELADGFLLASSPQTFDVILINEKDIKNDSKKTDMTLWELVEDPKAGDTLETCYLKNKATGGMLTSNYDDSDSSDGSADAKRVALQAQIDNLESKNPYIKIIHASYHWPAKFLKRNAGEVDLTDAIQKRIPNGAINYTLSDANCGKDQYSSWVNVVAGGDPQSGANKELDVTYQGPDGASFTAHTGETDPLVLTIPESSASKHPSWALRQQLAESTKRMKALGLIKKSDIGRTGFQGSPFGITQWAKIAIQPVVDFGIDDLGLDGEKLIIPAAANLGFVTQSLDNIWFHKRPEFAGFFQATQDKEFQEYAPGKIITVKPLFSKGFVWFDKMLQTSWYGTVVFRALSDGGDVQICFSDAVAPKTVYRIVFGAAENTKTVIYKNDVMVQEIDSDQQQNSRVIPGMIEQFWVSLNNGFMIVGKGDPGTNIIMAWQDPSPLADIKRIGFSTYKSTVKYTDVQMIDNPIVVVAPQKTYVIDQQVAQVGTVATPVWHQLPLSPADAGTIVFQATGSEDATLILANDKNEGYAIVFGSDGNTATKIIDLQSQNELCKIDAKNLSLAKLDVGTPNKFWVSFYRGLIILGKGKIGQNTFCMYVDGDVPDDVSKIGFAGKSTIQNLEIWPEVILNFDQNVAEYVKRKQSPLVQCKLNIITPFDYSVYQEGPSIVFRDRMTGMVTHIAGTPDVRFVYHFKLDIGADGIPKLIAGENSKTPETISLEVLVKAAESSKDAAFTASQQLAYATTKDTRVSLIALAGCAAFGLVGVGLSTVQAGLQTELDKMEATGKRQIYTENIIRAASGSIAVSDEVKQDRQEFEAKLKKIFGALPVAIANLELYQQLDYTTKLWYDALRFITGAYVVQDQGGRKSVISGLSDLYIAVKNLGLSDTTSSIYIRMINILSKAYNNPYLTTFGDILDDQTRSNWYLWINNLSKDFFSSPKFMKNGIEVNFKGQYLWFPVSFPQAGSGSVTFEATANSDIFVCFSENTIQQSDMLKNIYEIDIGKWDNKVTAIHRESLGDSVIEFDHAKFPDLSPDPMAFKKYWINIDKGIISCGVGDLGQNKLWEWKDPYSAVPVKWVGFSNWLSPVTVKNIKVGAVFKQKK